MLADLEKGVAFAFVHFLQLEDILVERDRLAHVVHLDREMIDSIHVHTHIALYLALLAAPGKGDGGRRATKGCAAGEGTRPTAGRPDR